MLHTVFSELRGIVGSAQVFDGQFEEGNIVSGKHTCRHGNVYTGEFSGFKYNGLGKLCYANGGHVSRGDNKLALFIAAVMSSISCCFPLT